MTNEQNVLIRLQAYYVFLLRIFYTVYANVCYILLLSLPENGSRSVVSNVSLIKICTAKQPVSYVSLYTIGDVEPNCQIF
jgi:hypothetical protein